jgi:hypothetical protein
MNPPDSRGYYFFATLYEELGFSPLGLELLDFLKKEDEDQEARKKLRATTLHKAMTMRGDEVTRNLSEQLTNALLRTKKPYICNRLLRRKRR